MVMLVSLVDETALACCCGVVADGAMRDSGWITPADQCRTTKLLLYKTPEQEIVYSPLHVR